MTPVTARRWARATDDDGDAVSMEALVGAAQGGDAMAMNELVDRLGPQVSRLCGSIALGDGPDAAQEALIAIFRSIGQLRQPEAVFGWARAIAVREAIRVARRARRSEPAPLYDLPARGDPQLAVDLHAVLARLSPEHRAVLFLRDMEGLDEHEVSAALTIPEGTVRSRLFRARGNLREEWTR